MAKKNKLAKQMLLNSIDEKTVLTLELFEKVYSHAADDSEFIIAFLDKIESLGIFPYCSDGNIDLIQYCDQRDEEMNKKENIRKENDALIQVSIDKFDKTQFIGAPMKLNKGEWICGPEGVYKFIPAPNGKGNREVRASYQQIIPVGIIEDIETGERKYTIAFSVKRDGRYIWKSITVRPSICASKNQIVNLSNLGVDVTEQTAKNLIEYIADMYRMNEDIPTQRAISHMGWVGQEFFPYTDSIVFNGDSEQHNIVQAIKQCGDFDTWKTECMKYRKNIAVRLMMDAAFASILIEKIGALCFVLHLYGTSNAGKTVSLITAASIWGEPDKLFISVDATQNYFTNRAAFLKNVPMLVDETQISRVAVEKMIYSLTEGKSRGRLGKDSREIENSIGQTFQFSLVKLLS